MRQKLLWSLLLFPFCLQAQLTEYNRKGDEAMRRKDYPDAKMWYEEGISYCDTYSINQLTVIWMENENMRSSMGPVMSKSLDCLNNMAISKKDTLAMKKLILFHSDGIGTSPDESAVASWREMLTQIRNPYVSEQSRPGKPREKMKFFAGLSSSPAIAPYGIQIGGMAAVGWYVRIRTNFVLPRKANETCINGEKTGDNRFEGKIPAFDPNQMYRFKSSDGEKSMWTGTAGLMFRVAPTVYLSAGGGYAQYDVLYAYEKIDNDGNPKPDEDGWARNRDTSYKGLAVDADATIVFGKRFYGTVGCSMLNMKHFYPTAGIGILLNIK
ncbi:MAG: hypothetical protein LBD27_02505 [Tannerella sp.]|jgi:hypothetical protein|nr:hypothetical protein [Tannerella sp.]